jgi:hypothetical protein
VPRYNYKCCACTEESIIFHMIDETIDICPVCNSIGAITKQLTKPFYTKNEKIFERKTGDLTKEYIELNKEILEEQKQEAEEETYEPS